MDIYICRKPSPKAIGLEVAPTYRAVRSQYIKEVNSLSTEKPLDNLWVMGVLKYTYEPLAPSITSPLNTTLMSVCSEM